MSLSITTLPTLQACGDAIGIVINVSAHFPLCSDVHIWRDSIYFPVHFYIEIVTYFTVCFVICSFHLVINQSYVLPFLCFNSSEDSNGRSFPYVTDTPESASAAFSQVTHPTSFSEASPAPITLLSWEITKARWQAGAFNFYIYSSLYEGLTLR